MTMIFAKGQVKAHINPGDYGRIREIQQHLKSNPLRFCGRHKIEVEIEIEYIPATIGPPLDAILGGCCRPAVQEVLRLYGFDVDRWIKPRLVKVLRSDLSDTPMERMFTDDDQFPWKMVMKMMGASPKTQEVVLRPTNEVEIEFNGLVYGIHNIEPHTGSTDTYYEIQLLYRRKASD